MSGVEVVSSKNVRPEGPLTGFFRKKVYQSDKLVITETHIPPGQASGWHHHGARELFVVVTAGRLRLEYGEKGSKSVEAVPGDYVRVPTGLVHRDVNPGRAETVVAAISLGEGPTTVEVAGP